MTGTPFSPQARTLDKDHGRVDRRRIRTTTALNDYLDFPHLRQVCQIERYAYDLRTGEQHTDYAYGLTDLSTLQARPEQLLAINRGHWAIESMHWIRDVDFDEDRCQVRKGHGPQVLACLRNVIIGLLRRLIRGTRTSIAAALRHFAACADPALALFCP